MRIIDDYSAYTSQTSSIELSTVLSIIIPIILLIIILILLIKFLKKHNYNKKEEVQINKEPSINKNETKQVNVESNNNQKEVVQTSEEQNNNIQKEVQVNQDILENNKNISIEPIIENPKDNIISIEEVTKPEIKIEPVIEEVRKIEIIPVTQPSKEENKDDIEVL